MASLTSARLDQLDKGWKPALGISPSFARTPCQEFWRSQVHDLFCVQFRSIAALGQHTCPACVQLFSVGASIPVPRDPAQLTHLTCPVSVSHFAHTDVFPLIFFFGTLRTVILPVVRSAVATAIVTHGRLHSNKPFDKKYATSHDLWDEEEWRADANAHPITRRNVVDERVLTRNGHASNWFGVLADRFLHSSCSSWHVAGLCDDVCGIRVLRVLSRDNTIPEYLIFLQATTFRNMPRGLFSLHAAFERCRRGWAALPALPRR